MFVLKITACWVILKPCITRSKVRCFNNNPELVLALRNSPRARRTPSRKPPALLGSYLHNPSLVHGTQYEQRVGRPLYVLDLVQARVQMEDLKAARIPDSQAVLHARRLGESKAKAELVSKAAAPTAPCTAAGLGFISEGLGVCCELQ